jgi:hypothetical protein
MAKESRKKKPRAKGLATIYGLRTARGEKMLKGPWRFISPHMLEFPATLVDTINIGKTRLAIFSVPKRETHPWPSRGHCEAFQCLHPAA